MRGIGGVPTQRVPPGVRPDALTAVQHFEHGRRETHRHRFSHERIRHAVEVFVYRDAVIDVHFRDAPLGVFIAFGGAGSKRRTVRLFKERPSLDGHQKRALAFSGRRCYCRRHRIQSISSFGRCHEDPSDIFTFGSGGGVTLACSDQVPTKVTAVPDLETHRSFVAEGSRAYETVKVRGRDGQSHTYSISASSIHRDGIQMRYSAENVSVLRRISAFHLRMAPKLAQIDSIRSAKGLLHRDGIDLAPVEAVVRRGGSKAEIKAAFRAIVRRTWIAAEGVAYEEVNSEASIVEASASLPAVLSDEQSAEPFESGSGSYLPNDREVAFLAAVAAAPTSPECEDLFQELETNLGLFYFWETHWDADWNDAEYQCRNWDLNPPAPPPCEDAIQDLEHSESMMDWAMDEVNLTLDYASANNCFGPPWQ